METPFAHPVERELARVVDEAGIPWEYEPTTFVLERAEDGSIVQAFTPCQRLTAFERLREAHGFPFETAA